LFRSMIFPRVLVILISVPLALSSCLYFDNHYVEWHIENDSLTFTLGKGFDVQWMAIGFNHISQTMQGASIFLYAQNRVYEYLSLSFERPQLIRSIDFNETTGDEFYEKHIQFKIPLNGSFEFKNQEQKLLF